MLAARRAQRALLPGARATASRASSRSWMGVELSREALAGAQGRALLSSATARAKWLETVEDSSRQEQQSSFLREIDLRSASGRQKLSKIIQEVVVTKTNTGGACG